MDVTTWTLDMLDAPAAAPRAFPGGCTLERADGMSPEYARFLYGLVGGAWFWTDRLGWSRDEWAAELAVPGTEFWVLYGDGVPLGYTHLQPTPVARGTQVEIRYFGLAGPAIGRGLGGRLLEHAVHGAWSIADRAGLPPVRRVWVHTCTLDGPAALANYLARGFAVRTEETAAQAVPGRPPGAWAATGGR